MMKVERAVWNLYSYLLNSKKNSLSFKPLQMKTLYFGISQHSPQFMVATSFLRHRT